MTLSVPAGRDPLIAPESAGESGCAGIAAGDSQILNVVIRFRQLFLRQPQAAAMEIIQESGSGLRFKMNGEPREADVKLFRHHPS